MRRQRLTGLPWLSRLVALVALLALQPAQAHLMPAQRGTLNLVGSGGFVVMALPVDAFTGIDDNGDGRLSAAELQAHATQIEAQVQRGLSLHDAAGPRTTRPTHRRRSWWCWGASHWLTPKPMCKA